MIGNESLNSLYTTLVSDFHITCGTHHRRRAFARHSLILHSLSLDWEELLAATFRLYFRPKRPFHSLFSQHFAPLMDLLFEITFCGKAFERLFSTLHLRRLKPPENHILCRHVAAFGTIFSGTWHQRAISHSLIIDRFFA